MLRSVIKASLCGNSTVTIHQPAKNPQTKKYIKKTSLKVPDVYPFPKPFLDPNLEYHQNPHPLQSLKPTLNVMQR